MVKQLGRFAAFLLLLCNACLTGLLLFSAYSPHIQPVEHPVLSCAGLAFPVFWLLNLCALVCWVIVQRYKSALLPLAGILLTVPQLRAYFPINSRTGDLPEAACKVLSYNVMGFADCAKTADGQNPILTYLKQSEADVICLQEYRVSTSSRQLTQKDVDRELSDYPYRRITFVDEGRSSRVACYSKFPILSARALDYASVHNGSVLYELKWGNDTVTLINNHLESNKLTKTDKELYEGLWEEPEKERLKSGLRLLIRKLAEASALRAPQADTIAREIEASPHRHIIVCGDFNDTPISYAHHTIARRLDDAFTESGRGLGVSYNQNRFYFRIDNILVSPSLQAHRCTVDRSIKDSDHYPIWCFVSKRP